MQNQNKYRTIYYSGAEQHLLADIQLDEMALVKSQLFAVCNPDVEVGGMLIGPQPVKQGNGRYLTSITDVILAQHTIATKNSITFTPSSWAQMNQERISQFPKVCLGWFHTHPGHGLFYSDLDIFLHTNFFSFDFMLGLVLDPIRKKLDIFGWNAKKEINRFGLLLPLWASQYWLSNGGS